MSALPQILINGRAFYLDERLREIRAVENPHEKYLLAQDVIPPAEAPQFRIPTDHQPQQSGLAAFIRHLPPEHFDIPSQPPPNPYANYWNQSPKSDEPAKARGRGK